MAQICACGTYSVGLCLDCGRDVCQEHSEIVEDRRLCLTHAENAKDLEALVPPEKRSYLRRFVGDDQRLLIWAQGCGEWGGLFDFALTSDYLVVITRFTDEVQRIPRDAVTKVDRMPLTARGQFMRVEAVGFKPVKIWELTPKGNGQSLVYALRSTIVIGGRSKQVAPAGAGISPRQPGDAASEVGTTLFGCAVIIFVVVLILWGLLSFLGWLFT